MERIGNALTDLAKARQEYEVARVRAVETVIGCIAESDDGCYASDIAEHTEAPSCVIAGLIRSAQHTHEGERIESRRERRTTVYARINRDGSVNMNDTIERNYWVNKYRYIPR